MCEKYKIQSAEITWYVVLHRRDDDFMKGRLANSILLTAKISRRQLISCNISKKSAKQTISSCDLTCIDTGSLCSYLLLKRCLRAVCMTIPEALLAGGFHLLCAAKYVRM